MVAKGAWPDYDVFPACAGMNRDSMKAGSVCARVPRVRGDEPESISGIRQVDACSPRARG